MGKHKMSWEDFLGSSFYNAANIETLQQQMANYSTDRTALGQQADTLLRPGYNSQELALRQELESMLGGLGNQLSGLGLSYEQQQRGINSQFNQSGSAALNQLGKRGLGRSSIVGTTVASLEGGRNQALADVAAKRTDAEADILNNVSLAQRQNASSLRGLTDNYAAQRQAKAEEMYGTNAAAQANLQAQIAQLQQAAYAAYVAYWTKKNKTSGHRSTSRPSTPSSSTSGRDDSDDLSGGGMAEDDPAHFSHYF